MEKRKKKRLMLKFHLSEWYLIPTKRSSTLEQGLYIVVTHHSLSFLFLSLSIRIVIEED